MTAFLARLDGHLITALFSLADLLLDLDTTVSKLEARWRARGSQRTPVAHRAKHVACHRLRGKARTFNDVDARRDYEWGQALKAWASRTEGQYLQWQ